MKKLLFIALTLFSFSLSFAQNKVLDTVWEKQNPIQKDLSIENPSYTGSNSTGHYAISIEIKPSSTNYTLIRFDQKTNLISATVDISPQKNSNKALKSEPGMKMFHDIIVMEEKVHVFYTNMGGRGSELFAMTFDKDLKTSTPLKKLSDQPFSAFGQSETSSSFFVLADSKFNNNIIVGYEKGLRGKEAITVLKIFDENFELLESKETPLPFIFNFATSGDYSLLSTGHVLLSTRIKEEIPTNSGNTRKKKNFWYYYVYTIINSSTGEAKVLPLRDDNNNVIVFPNARQVNGSLIIDACYYESDDLVKNKEQNYMEGTFHAEIDLAKGELSKVNFTPFDDKTYHTIYSSNKTNTSNPKNEQKEAPLTELKTEYVIEKDGNLFYVCSKFDEIFKYVGNGRNESVIYTLVKGDIILLKINSNATIEWCKTIERNKNFDKWTEEDIFADIENNDLIILFESDRKALDAKGKEVPINEFTEYAIADINTGTINSDVLLLNPAGKETKIRKEFVSYSHFNFNEELISFGITYHDKSKSLSLIKFSTK